MWFDGYAVQVGGQTELHPQTVLQQATSGFWPSSSCAVCLMGPKVSYDPTVPSLIPTSADRGRACRRRRLDRRDSVTAART